MKAKPLGDPRKARDARLRLMYGISLEEWDAILAAQGGGCAVCGRPGVTRSLHTDHSHKSKLTRGILCAQHNAGLRKFSDNPEYLRAAAAYLDNPPAFAVVGEREARNVKRRRRRRAVKRKQAQRPQRLAAKKARKK